MSNFNYYGVHKGRHPGVYETWEDCQSQTCGFPGNAFKGFYDRESAEYYVTHGESSELLNVMSDYDFEPDYILYIDGSCQPNPGASGVGLAVYKGGEHIEDWYGAYEPNSTSPKAELTALHEALLYAKKRCKESDKVLICTDSEYAEKSSSEWYGNRSSRTAHLRLIEAIYALREGLEGVVRVVRVPAHKGVIGNERADRLAKYAVMSCSKRMVEHKNFVV